MADIVSSVVSSIIAEYARKIVEKATQGKRITAPELMVLVVSEMDRRLTSQVESLRREFEARFKGLEDRLKGLEDRFNDRFASLESRFEARFKGLEDRIDGRISSLESEFKALSLRVEDLKFYVDQYHRELSERIRKVEERLSIS
ncbi:MAG: hypothetical protein N3H31_04350 [Candidatus Nezhaarchaeota archaeon]|nr:hypothetical protein [Candidatus Nezhaarchaeota archaeon]